MNVLVVAILVSGSSILNCSSYGKSRLWSKIAIHRVSFLVISEFLHFFHPIKSFALGAWVLKGEDTETGLLGSTCPGDGPKTQSPYICTFPDKVQFCKLSILLYQRLQGFLKFSVDQPRADFSLWLYSTEGALSEMVCSAARTVGRQVNPREQFLDYLLCELQLLRDNYQGCTFADYSFRVARDEIELTRIPYTTRLA
nr:probable inactive purple acid phosphatase 27 [Ipomoea batatas]